MGHFSVFELFSAILFYMFVTKSAQWCLFSVLFSRQLDFILGYECFSTGYRNVEKKF